MPYSVFHISGYMAQFCEQKTQTHAECHIHCYTSNSLAVLELQLSHQSCDTSWTHTSAFNMFLQFADLSANWKRHQSRSLSLSLLTLHFFYFLFLSSVSTSISLFLACSFQSFSWQVHQLAIQVEFREFSLTFMHCVYATYHARLILFA